MKPFLQRYIERVKTLVGDPNTSQRLDASYLYQRVHEVDAQIFELLISASGQEDTMSFAEATIGMRNNVQYYPLPDGFRRFLSFVAYDDTGITLDSLNSRSHYSSGSGIEILSGHQGFRVMPKPLQDSERDWTLGYIRGPGLLHYAKAETVDGDVLIGSVPGTDAGSLVRKKDYYNGLTLSLYSPDDTAEGVPQTAVVRTFRWENDKPVFQMRTDFQPTRGEVWYEVLPCAGPYPYDSVYGLHTAMEILTSRRQFDLVQAIVPLYQKAWQAAKQYITSQVADRAPQRLIPPNVLDLMPTGEIPYA